MALDLTLLINPFINLFSVLKDLVILIIGAILPVFSYFFSLGEIAVAKAILFCMITFYSYKAGLKLTSDSTAPAMIIALIISLLGIKLVPEGVLQTFMTQGYVFLILGLFLGSTLIVSLTWWLRKTVILLISVASFIAWYSYRLGTGFLVISISSLILLLLDNKIHLWIISKRRSSTEKSRIRTLIKQKEQERTDAIIAKADKKEIAAIEAELDRLVESESELESE